MSMGDIVLLVFMGLALVMLGLMLWLVVRTS